MPHTLIDVLMHLQNHSATIDGVETNPGANDSHEQEVYAEWLSDLDVCLSNIGLDHSSLVGAATAHISFEAWATAYLTDLARDNGADIADDAVGTWIASHATGLTNALQKCAMGFMLDADPIPGGDDA